MSLRKERTKMKQSKRRRAKAFHAAEKMLAMMGFIWLFCTLAGALLRALGVG